MKQLPDAHSLARWLGQFDDDAVIALRRVNEELVGHLLRSMDLSRLTIGIDGSVLCMDL